MALHRRRSKGANSLIVAMSKAGLHFTKISEIEGRERLAKAYYISIG